MPIPKDDLTYTVFSEIYLRINEPKGKRKAFHILEGALSAYAKKGWDRVTLEMIAREAGTSRTGLLHYFKDAKELRVFSIKYVRLLFQKFAIDAIAGASDPRQMLEAYVRSCFTWIDQKRTHSRVWLSFLSVCSHSKTDRALNTEAVHVGEERLSALMLAGRKAGRFDFDDALKTAKAIQVLITGAMICYGTEDFEDNGKDLIATTISNCLSIAGAK